MRKSIYKIDYIELLHYDEPDQHRHGFTFTETMFTNKIESAFNYAKEIENFDYILITEIPLNRLVTYGRFNSQYLYDKNGNIIEERKYKDDKFNGRDPSTLRFKKGDKVSVTFENGNIVNGVVYDVPPSPNENASMDRYDDSYTVLMDVDEIPEKMDAQTYMRLHEHVEVINIFERFNKC